MKREAATTPPTTTPPTTEPPATEPPPAKRSAAKPSVTELPADTTRRRPRAAGGRGPLVAAVVSTVWFAVTLWFTHRAATTAPDPQRAVVDAALTLPLLLASGVVAAAATAVVVTGRISRLRWLAGAAVGLVVGAAAGGLLLAGYGTAAALVQVAAAMAVTAAAGGALAGVPATAVVVAGVTGCLARFAVGLVEGVFNGRLQGLFGADGSPATQLAAAGRVSLAMAMVGGAVAALAAFGYLRRRGEGPGWPAYLAAGAAAGLVLLVADVATRLGGAALLRLVGAASEADRIALDYVADSRLNTALVVLFTGAVVAIVAYGRTLRPTR